MLDHTHIISQLTEGQKIRLLTDIHSLAEPEFTALGIPQVRCGSVRDVRGEGFPTPASLARSWDKALMNNVTEAQCRLLAGQGYDHVYLPEAKVRVMPYGQGLSEDPVLAGELVGACLAGANRAGLSASLCGYGFTDREVARLGGELASRELYGFLELPYLRALRGGACSGLVTETTAEMPPEMAFGQLLRRSAEGQDTVTAIAGGQICLHGSAAALQGALHNYRRMKTAIEHGRVTTGELEAACACGEAMSEETLDGAVEHLLTFAEACDTHPIPETVAGQYGELAARAARGAVVLLENRRMPNKNQPILPLRSGSGVCLIGDMLRAGGLTMQGASDVLAGAGLSVLGHARGYDLGSDRSDGLLQEALPLANMASTIVLFLGVDSLRASRMEKERRTTLPANQLALFHGLSRLGKPMITVISGAVSLDMSFLASAVHETTALLLAPLESPYGVAAVADTLVGRHNPSGRMTVTLCARELFPESARDTRRVGPFVGYRYYDTLGYGALYPFGHGLSYTSFQYSLLQVKEGQISFVVKNTGRRAGVETAQVYLGMTNSRVIRPKKELIGFSRVELKPGQATKVTLPLEILPLRCEDGRLLLEQGTYELSVGASVSDIRLHTTLKAGQDLVPPEENHPEEYLSSVSNIQSQHFTMEAAYTPMKPSLKNLLFGIAALVLAVSLKLYDILTAADSVFLDIVAGILTVGAAVFFAMEIADRRKQHAEERERIEEANRLHFADASLIPMPSAAELFALEDEWERRDDRAGEDSEENSGADTEEAYDHFADVDREMTFGDAVRALTVLAREKGITVSEGTAKSIFSALAASRLVVVRDMNQADFAALAALLGEYFSSPVFVDTVDESYRSETDVLFATDEFGNHTPRGVLKVLQNAQREPGKIHLAALAGVEAETMSGYFVPFARHAHAPRSGCTVDCRSVMGEDTCLRIPENLWFLVNLRQDAALFTLPDYIAEIATVNAWTLETKGYMAEGHSEFRRFSYGQMDYLCDRLRSGFIVDEETWKQIDRLEAYAARYGGFRIGNKLWLGMELYMAVLMSLDVDEPTARDEAMAVKLMPSLLAALSGRIPRGERGLGETMDAVFGEDHTALCRKTIKESGADLI